MKLGSSCHTFNGNNFGALCPGGRHHAAHHCHAIQKHRAGAAFTLRTAFFGSHQQPIFPQEVQQRLILAVFQADLPAIDRGLDWDGIVGGARMDAS